MNLNNCKSCTENIKANMPITQDEVKVAIDKLARIKKIKFVSDSIYEFRLQQCTNCKYLEYGTTCLQCGCLVEIRAKLIDGKCPYPKISKW